MSRRLLIAFLLMALDGWMSTEAYAQLRDNIEVNVFGGGSFYSHKDYTIGFPQTIVPNEGEFHLDRAVRAGVRVGVYDHGHWSEELFYSYDSNRAHFILAAPPNSPSVVPPNSPLAVPITVHNYGVTALYYLNDGESHSFRPFLSIGIGGTLYHMSLETETFVRSPFQGGVLSMHSSNELAMNYGFGVKTRVNHWLGFRFDAKGFLGSQPSFGVPRRSNDPLVQVLPLSGAIQNGEVSAGLVFYFFGWH
jgi:hypothetical protein